MKTSETIGDIAGALSKAQAEMGQPKQDRSNPRLGNGYATLTAVQDATRPVLAKHGLAIVQSIGGTGEVVEITTRLVHDSGQWIEDAVAVGVEIPTSNAGKAILSRGQAMGVSITYQRRYAWAAMCGVASEKDEDGESAGDGGTWTPPGAAVAAPSPVAAAPITNTTTTPQRGAW